MYSVSILLRRKCYNSQVSGILAENRRNREIKNSEEEDRRPDDDGSRIINSIKFDEFRKNDIVDDATF